MRTQSTLVWIFTVALLGALALNGPSFAQNADQDRPRGDQNRDEADRGPERRPDGDRGRGDRGDRGRFDPQEMQARMAQAMKERLKASDDEWAIIGPRLQKVTELTFRGGGPGGGFFAFRGGPGGPGGPGGDRNRGPGGDRGPGDRGPAPGGGDREQSEVGQKTRALGELLRNESPKPEEVKKALGDLRKAREKQETDLKKAREELREVLTLQQEATLVLIGILD